MTAQIQTVVGRLQTDWDFIGQFLDNPRAALSGFDLSEEEFNTLTARDPDALMALGFGEEAVVAALSGGHRGETVTIAE